jgi:hypothetical protein
LAATHGRGMGNDREFGFAGGSKSLTDCLKGGGGGPCTERCPFLTDAAGAGPISAADPFPAKDPPPNGTTSPDGGCPGEAESLCSAVFGACSLARNLLHTHERVLRRCAKLGGWSMGVGAAPHKFSESTVEPSHGRRFVLESYGVATDFQSDPPQAGQEVVNDGAESNDKTAGDVEGGQKRDPTVGRSRLGECDSRVELSIEYGVRMI